MESDARETGMVSRCAFCPKPGGWVDLGARDGVWRRESDSCKSRPLKRMYRCGWMERFNMMYEQSMGQRCRQGRCWKKQNVSYMM